MKPYKEYSVEELTKEELLLSQKLNYLKSLNLSLNMARGKPCKEQLNLSMGMMDVLTSQDDLTSIDGTDVRNYGELTGIPECKKLLSDIIEVDPANIIIYGNSSLNIMFDIVAKSFVKGVCGNTPWSKLPKVKFLCPVPGYDRHFAICEYFGIEMINIKMNNDGPDMNQIEKLVSEDDSIKAIWCVPKYSNPEGNTYSEEVVKRFASLKPKAKDFRIYWDNAYSVHHLYDEPQDFLLEILDECKKAGNEDMVYKFTSTSKISFPGSGIAALASSPKNIEDMRKHLSFQTISHDKVNQLRHVRFFKDLNGVKEQMRKHAEILRPKFELVEDTFDKELSSLEIASWTKPHGGYFISFYTIPGIASKVVKRCGELGLTLTPAGSSYPYHKDPDDSNIRIAPSYPTIGELRMACEIFITVLKFETIKQYISLKK